MSNAVGQLFSKLTAVVASPASSVQNHHKMVIDRKTIEKTWKYMDKVRPNHQFYLIHTFKFSFGNDLCTIFDKRLWKTGILEYFTELFALSDIEK